MNRSLLTLAIVFITSFLFAQSTFIWDGGGDGFSWDDALNWDTDLTPSTGSTVIFKSITPTDFLTGEANNISQLICDTFSNLILDMNLTITGEGHGIVMKSNSLLRIGLEEGPKRIINITTPHNKNGIQMIEGASMLINPSATINIQTSDAAILLQGLSFFGNLGIIFSNGSFINIDEASSQFFNFKGATLDLGDGKIFNKGYFENSGLILSTFVTTNEDLVNNEEGATVLNRGFYQFDGKFATSPTFNDSGLQLVNGMVTISTNDDGDDDPCTADIAEMDYKWTAAGNTFQADETGFIELEGATSKVTLTTSYGSAVQVVVTDVCGTPSFISANCPSGMTVEIPSGSTTPASWVEPITATTCDLSSEVTITQVEGPLLGSEIGIGSYLIIYNFSDACENNEACSFILSVIEKANPVSCGEITGFTKLGQRDGHGYYLSEKAMTWKSGHILAQANSGYLSSIQSKEENEFINDLTSDVIFIGLNDYEKEGAIVWANGEAVNYTNYANCLWCNENGDEFDGLSLSNWDGTWMFEHYFVERKIVMEKTCEASALTLSCPTNIKLVTLKDTESINWSEPLATTSCSLNNEVTLLQTIGMPSGNNFELGSYTIGYQATDNCGNVEACTFNINLEAEEICVQSIDGFTKLGEWDKHGYYISNNSMTWAAAHSMTLSMEGEMVTISSQEENDFLYPLLQVQAFTGMNDANNEGSPEWADGSEMNYTNFTPSCVPCGLNTDTYDYGVLSPWNGEWYMNNAEVERPFILETVCGELRPYIASTSPPIQSKSHSKLYPNPASEEIVLEINAPQKGLVELTILNIRGQQVQLKHDNLYNGFNRIILDINDFIPGIYFLRITGKNHDEYIRFTKVNM